MTTINEPQVKWSPDMMVEISLSEPDDFLKVRETLTRIGVASRKEKSYINQFIFFISKANTILSALRSYLHLMVSMRI